MISMLARRIAPLFVTTVLVAAPAWAQTTAPSTTGTTATTPGTAASGPSGTVHKAMPRRSASVPAGETMEAMVESRLSELHKRLQITAEQGQQWDQFAQVMRDNAKAMDQLYKERAEKLATMSAVEDMQSYAQIEQERAQDMQKLVPAFQSLYASLSDQQKQTADRMFRYQAARAQAHRQAAAAKHTNTKTSTP